MKNNFNFNSVFKWLLTISFGVVILCLSYRTVYADSLNVTSNDKVEQYLLDIGIPDFDIKNMSNNEKYTIYDSLTNVNEEVVFPLAVRNLLIQDLMLYLT